MSNTTDTRKATVTLPADDQILIRREFDAPRHLVYRAWTTPELVKRWWAGKRGEMTLAEIDLRVGEYRELVENERIVSTEVYEGAPDGEAVNTLTLTEQDGRTTMTILVQHQSQAFRDMHIESGMEGGMNESLDALEQVARALA
jgi:uncharacterized protein YndB with AHSA1/START domain